MNKDNWNKDKRKTVNYLYFDKKHTNSIINRILDDYGIFNNIITKKRNKICIAIQSDWGAFMTWYKQQKYPATAKPKRRKSYRDCWNESNLDGSFAYNG